MYNDYELNPRFLVPMLESAISFLENSQSESINPEELLKPSYRFFNMQSSQNEKYLPGGVGENWVQFYYQEIQRIPFIPQYPIDFDDDGEIRTIRPDGFLPTRNQLIEVKTRLDNNGSVHEKIPAITWKYNHARTGKKLVIVLLGDDEYKYNRSYVKLMRGIREPVDEFEYDTLKRDNLILDAIVYGSQIARQFRRYLRWIEDFRSE